jgi:DNA-binding MarR family transcriptional regulator
MRSARPSAGKRYQALLQLLRTADTLWNSSRVFFARWDLSPSQFNVLNLLNDKPDGMSQIELGRRLIMHRSNVTGLIDRLEARSLVRRKNADRDRRAYRIIVTAAGAKLLRQIVPEYYRLANDVWNGFPVATANRWENDLKRLAANASKIVTSKEAS